MTTLFIADLHLQAGRPDVTQAFFEYLDVHAQKATALYILGDLFEHWIGDDGMGPFEHQVAEALSRYAHQGRSVYVMPGNRDFLLGKAFAARAHLTLLDDPTLITLGDQRVLLMHGDSMCTEDQAYMHFRAQVRSHAWQQQVLTMPLDQRVALAAQLRAQSGEANATKSETIMDVTPDAVIAEMQKADVDVMIHGHTHRPNTHRVDLGHGHSGRRLVLGDWCYRTRSMWEAAFENGALCLAPYQW